jgi:hypothetical protein
MKITITVTATETREVVPADYALPETTTEAELLDAVVEEIRDCIEDFIDQNGADIQVAKAVEEPLEDLSYE